MWNVEWKENGKTMYENFLTEWAAREFAIKVNGIITEIER